MWNLLEPPLFTELSGSRNVLIAGAGGGFDIYGGLPLALALHKQGKRVHHAFDRTGVRPLRRAYRELVAKHDIDLRPLP